MIGQTQAPGVSTTPTTPGTGSVRSCGFESRGICGYTQDTTDQFNWTWKAGRTSTSSTGPSNDHTYGTARGRFSFFFSIGYLLVVQEMILFITRYFFCQYDGGIIIFLILQCHQMKIYYFPPKMCHIDKTTSWYISSENWQKIWTPVLELNADVWNPL